MLKKLMKAALVAAMVCAIGCGAQALDYTGGGGGGGGSGAASAKQGADGQAASAADGSGDTSAKVDTTGSEAAVSPAAAAGGAGGAGGDYEDDVAIDFTAGETVNIKGGAGGDAGGVTTTLGQNAGAGGRGGDVIADLIDTAEENENSILTSNINIIAGKGGAGTATDSTPGGTGASGGRGGNVTVNYTGEILTLSGNKLSIAGGQGGTGASGFLAGVGGHATFNAAESKIVLSDGAIIDVKVGAVGSTTATQGGDAIVKIGTLAAGVGGGQFLVGDSAVGGDGTGNKAGNYKIEIGGIEAIDDDLLITLVTGSINVGAADKVSLGTISIGDGAVGRKLAFEGATTAGTVVAQTDFTWNKQLVVKGADNTLTMGTAAGFLDASGSKGLITFDLTGVTANSTMLTGRVEVDSNTKFALTGMTTSLLGRRVNLISIIEDGTNEVAAFSKKVSEEVTQELEEGTVLNTATISGQIFNAGTVTTTASAGDKLELFVNGFNAAKNWVEENGFVLTGTATTAVSYAVGGELTLTKDSDIAITDGGAGALVDIAKLNVTGDSALTFAGTTASELTAATKTNSVKIGDIILQAGSTLNIAGQQFLAASTDPKFAASGNYSWTGNLTTFDNVAIKATGSKGSDNKPADIFRLNGKAITSNLSEGFELGENGDTIISGNISVDEKTKMTIVADAAHEETLRAGTTLNLFNSQDESLIAGKDNAILLQQENVVVKTEAYDINGTYVDGQLTNTVAKLNEEYTTYAHVAGLSAAAGMSLINSGASTIERAAGAFTPMAIQAGTIGGMQFGAFAALGGESVEIDTGSGVDSDNFNLVLGPGLRINTGTGRTDVGAFFEAGWGNYDAFDGAFRGEGDNEYYGGGLMFRYESCSGFYGEASARFGSADIEFASQTSNSDFDFNYDSDYAGGHLGLGYIFRPSEAVAVDVFAKGFVSRMDGVVNNDADKRTLDIDNTTSIRSQIGAKFAYNLSSAASVFVKGAWEHEFDGETAIRYNGDRIRSSDFGGSSFVGAVGFDVRIAECATLGASVFGVAGKRDGFGGNINLAIGF